MLGVIGLQVPYDQSLLARACLSCWNKGKCHQFLSYQKRVPSRAFHAEASSSAHNRAAAITGTSRVSRVHPPKVKINRAEGPSQIPWHKWPLYSPTEISFLFIRHTLNKQASCMERTAIRTCPLLRNPWQLARHFIVQELAGFSHTTVRVGASSSSVELAVAVRIDGCIFDPQNLGLTVNTV